MGDRFPDLATLQRETMTGLLGKIVVVRLVLGPLLAAVFLAVTWLDPQPWRSGLAIVLLGVLGLLSAVEYWRFRRGMSGPRALPANAVVMVLLQLGGVALTGGIDSPLAVVVPVTALQLSIVLGGSAPLAVAVASQLAVIWLFAVLHLRGVALALPQLGAGSDAHAGWTAAVLSLVLFAAVALGLKVRAVVVGQIQRALTAHHSELVAHEEHARDLAVLAGEIAHELKNPLASIKGLAALLAKDVVAGRSAERLTVLRSEVDRMQETLEGFLTFSRPLVPLEQAPIDARQLAEEVAALCEGFAHGRGVTVHVADGAAPLRADRRKLRQVLVNLVQNAIEASAPGAVVTLRMEAGDPVTIEVLDRGAGLPWTGAAPATGVSTKDQGSGLGLAIARALVAQHTGTLDLAPRAGGGTVARVTLPADGAP